jgi:hypothetical protein
MLHWKDSHYARATEFARLVADAIGSPPMPAPHPTAISSPRPLAPASIPKPAAPTTAAVFKSIPWKK